MRVVSIHFPPRMRWIPVVTRHLSNDRTHTAIPRLAFARHLPVLEGMMSWRTSCAPLERTMPFVRGNAQGIPVARTRPTLFVTIQVLVDPRSLAHPRIPRKASGVCAHTHERASMHTYRDTLLSSRAICVTPNRHSCVSFPPGRSHSRVACHRSPEFQRNGGTHPPFQRPVRSTCAHCREDEASSCECSRTEPVQCLRSARSSIGWRRCPERVEGGRMESRAKSHGQ